MKTKHAIMSVEQNQNPSSALPEWVLTQEEQEQIAVFNVLTTHSPRSTLQLTIPTDEARLAIVSEYGTASLYLCLLAPGVLSGEIKAAVHKWLFLSNELAYLKTATLIEARPYWESEYY